MKWKHLVRYPLSIRLARRAIASRAACEETRDASTDRSALAFDLYTDRLLFDCGRHLTCMAATAERLGSNVFLRCSKLMLAAIAHKPLGRDLLAMPHVRWVLPSQSLPPNSVVLLDVERPSADRELSGQRTASMLIGRDFVSGVPVMPYPMFPCHIARSNPQRRALDRRRPKSGIFFGGNQTQRYGRDSMRAGFGVMPRLEILQTLRNRYADRIEARSADGGADRIVLRDSSIHPIAAERWLDVLAKHRFFLCCPGASQPVCHNLIEAMSVGAVPILEYSDRLRPRLVDGENAICFEGKRGLIDAIARIDGFSPDQLERLSRGAGDYFDRHLDGEVFLSKVLDHGLLERSGAVIMPFHNENFFDAKSFQLPSRAAA